MTKSRDRNIFIRNSVYWIRYSVNGKQKRESTGSDKKEDARLLIGKRLQEIAAGKEPEIKKIKNHTFEELAIEYYKWCERQRSIISKRLFIKQLAHLPQLRLNFDKKGACSSSKFTPVLSL